MKKIFSVIIIVAFSFSSRAQNCITVLSECDDLGFSYCGPYELSKGIYRIPYIDGTEVEITNDHLNHCPRGRIDMIGTDGDVSGEYKIAAAADGWVRAVVENESVQCDCSVSSCENNYVWMEHANGEWSKYTHFKQNSVVVSEGAFITAGTTLGNEGDVGCASGQHLHFEIAQPVDTNTLVFSESGGYIDGAWAKNMIPVICGISGNVFQDGVTYIADDCPTSCSGFVLFPITVSIGEYEVILDDDDLDNDASFTIESNGAVLFQAATSITLKPDFAALSGANFNARIGDCDESPLKSESTPQQVSVNEKNQFEIYPNPTMFSSTISFIVLNEGEVKIVLEDLNGRTVKVIADGNFVAGKYTQQIELNNLSKGIYLVRKTEQGLSLIKKLIVQ
ncbi:MAG: peptidoglycan DD-metalloendopeptidase family protein [Chitinophagales bacterium]|nr:peptidoglycan DD-metalloendopeptidase family protein [Chitinophagales bacterium]